MTTSKALNTPSMTRFSGKTRVALLQSALDDCRSLQAYAAHSNLALEETLTVKLTESMIAVERNLAESPSLTPHTAQIEAAFWTCYDQLAAAMYPVSAVSIAFSEEIAQRSAIMSLKNPATWTIKSPTLWTLFFFFIFICLQSWNLITTDLYGKVRDFEKQQETLQTEITKILQNSSLKGQNKVKPESDSTPKQLKALELTLISNHLLHRSLCASIFILNPIDDCDSIKTAKLPQIDDQSSAIQVQFEAMQRMMVLQRNLTVKLADCINVVMQALLPALLGLLGALTFELRRVHDQVRSYQYLPTTSRGLFTRVTLGMIGGIFGVLLLPTTEWLSSGTIKLPTVLLPFVLGYGAEIFYRFLDHLIANLGPKKPEPQSNAAQLSNLDVKRLKDIGK
jgi:hypothetical protein